MFGRVNIGGGRPRLTCELIATLPVEAYNIDNQGYVYCYKNGVRYKYTPFGSLVYQLSGEGYKYFNEEFSGNSKGETYVSSAYGYEGGILYKFNSDGSFAFIREGGSNRFENVLALEDYALVYEPIDDKVYVYSSSGQKFIPSYSSIRGRWVTDGESVYGWSEPYIYKVRPSDWYTYYTVNAGCQSVIGATQNTFFMITTESCGLFDTSNSDILYDFKLQSVLSQYSGCAFRDGHYVWRQGDVCFILDETLERVAIITDVPTTGSMRAGIDFFTIGTNVYKKY